ncbi:MAG: hypothetical protein NC489_45785, partial [Ruminococcus flavefaciens]|nr:hypothetical protein [Ruminococcus flavefaciens]
MKGKSIKSLEREVTRKKNALSKKLFGKPFDKLTETEKKDFWNAYEKDNPSSHANTLIQVEHGGTYERPEDKPVNPALSSFCKLAYRPLSIIIFIIWIALAIMALLYAYELWKVVS